jgi:hypothetical protein
LRLTRDAAGATRPGARLSACGSIRGDRLNTQPADLDLQLDCQCRRAFEARVVPSASVQIVG